MTDFERELVSLMPRFKRFALRLTKSRLLADDLVQDTILRALEHREQYQEGTNLNAWVHRIMFNHYAAGLRRSWRTVNDTDGHAAATLKTMPAQMANLLMKDFEKVYLKMSEHDRRIMDLYCIEGKTILEVSEIMEIPEGTVKSRTFRVRKRLKDVFGDNYGDMEDTNSKAVVY